MSTRRTALLTQIRQALDELEAIDTPATSADSAPASAAAREEWTNGMSPPDRFGRVKLQAIEQFRRERGAEFKRQNFEIPEFYFVGEAIDTFGPLSELQIQNIVRNTGSNARPGFAGRDGRAIRVEQDERGFWNEVETFTSASPHGNTGATYAYAAADAAEELKTRFLEQIQYEREQGVGSDLPTRGRG
jgi:hypothetical protein